MSTGRHDTVKKPVIPARQIGSAPPPGSPRAACSEGAPVPVTHTWRREGGSGWGDGKEDGPAVSVCGAGAGQPGDCARDGPVRAPGAHAGGCEPPRSVY